MIPAEMKRGSNLRLQSENGVIRNGRRMGGTVQRRKMSLECCAISPVTLTSHFLAVATNCPQACGREPFSQSPCCGEPIVIARIDCHSQEQL